MRISVEQLREAFPQFEERGQTIRGYSHRHRTIFLGKQMAGEKAPFDMREMQDLDRILDGIGLAKREVIEPEYQKALGKAPSRPAAWKQAAQQCAQNYFAANDRVDPVLVRRAQTAINTLDDFISGDPFELANRLQFIDFKEEVEYKGQTLHVAGTCPFSRKALDILGTAYKIMGVPVRLPKVESVTELPLLMNSMRSRSRNF